MPDETQCCTSKLISNRGNVQFREPPRRKLHSPRTERIMVTPPSAPSAQSVQTKKKPPVDAAISG